MSADTNGNVYIADSGNHRVRRVDSGGTVTTFAGTGTAGYSGEGYPATRSKLDRPEEVASDAGGNVYVLEAGLPRVRIIEPSGTMRTFAGNGTSDPISVFGYPAWFLGDQATRGPLFEASSLAVGSIGMEDPAIHLGEFSGGSLIRSVPLASGRMELLFRNMHGGPVKDLAIGSMGNLYFADGEGIWVIELDGSVSLIADIYEYGISVGGLAVDQFERIWFSDPEHRRVRVLEPVR